MSDDQNQASRLVEQQTDAIEQQTDARAAKESIERAMLSMRQEDFERIYSSVWKDEILKGKKKSEQKTEQAGRLAQETHQPKSGDDGGGSGASPGQISSPSLTERTETQPPDPRRQLDFLLNKD
ncbi:hypothetical protein LTS10_013216 [Elasticomyces elasticus]|nr:hypothetical protein LTS10_013216 [Elasticomyces elasticus]